MQYPLREKIGDPALLVGREEMFRNFDKWLNFIPRSLSKSRVILARRKSGKTAFIQRIFNKLWTEGKVIPFYLEIGENKLWYLDFAFLYYRTFVTQYISFIERDPKLLERLMTFEQIRAYGVAKSNDLLVHDVDSILHDAKSELYGLVWYTIYWAPHRMADYYDQRVLVILDEFQNITQYIYQNRDCLGDPDESMAGSFHAVSESKVAPMLVTGSHVGWLLTVIGKYLEAGRLSRIRMSPYLTAEEGLQAVYKYADIYQEPITNQTALQINELCMSDPFFISCVILSNYPGKDLTTTAGVIQTVDYEITDRESEMFRTWSEYIELALQRINGHQSAKRLFLHLTRENDQDWKPRQLKEILNLDIDEDEIQRELLVLAELDVIARGVSDIRFRGLKDGTLNLVLRNRFEEEINDFVPDVKNELQQKIDQLQAKNRSLQGRVNQLSGRVAEDVLANEFRRRKQLHLSTYFTGVKDDRALNVVQVHKRLYFQRPSGENEEIDVLIVADSCVVMIEAKNRQDRAGLKAVKHLWENAQLYAAKEGVEVLPAFYSRRGFTKDAKAFCEEQGIGMAEEIGYLLIS